MSSLTFPPRKPTARKGDRFLFSSSDDHALIKQVESTHAPDDRNFNLNPLLQIVKDVFHRATPAIPGVGLAGHAQPDALDERALSDDMDELLEILSRTIYRISCELTCKCSGGGDANSSAMAILSLVSNYKWDAKLIMTLAGFAVIYGEFGLEAKLYSSNYLAKGIALLKQLPSIPEQKDALKPKFEAITKLIQATLDVSNCIVQFKELPSQYISHDTQELASATAYIPAAVYWSIRAAIACALQIVGLIGSGHEYVGSTQESWELLSLAHKLNSIHEHLTKQLTACHKLIDQRKYIEAYQMLVRLFSIPHIDNSKILIALFPDEEIYDSSTKKKVSLNVLRRKLVLLLISDLDISQDELLILDQMYKEARQQPSRAESQYEVVWLPIVAEPSAPWTEEMEKQFESQRDKMPWYSVHPTRVDSAVVKYVKKDWGFNKKPILVVLDQQGKVVNENAMHMMWIWGSLAYPFTSTHEEALWKDATWGIDLLADSIETAITNWMQEDKYICLYGGEDMEWIKKITSAANAAATAAKVPLEMLYVGKSNPRDKIRKNIAAILAEELSHTLPDLTLVWFFWIRLESMWHSKTKHKKSDETENDPTMQEIMTILTYDGSEEGWALVNFRATEMARAKGETMLRCFKDHSAWTDLVPEKGLVGAINDYLQRIHTPHHCNRLILPGTEGGIPERVVCAECGKTMEKFLMYRCCTD